VPAPAVLQTANENPKTLKEPCAPLVDVPHRDLTEKEVGDLWGTDRINYGDCIAKNAALIKAGATPAGKAVPK